MGAALCIIVGLATSLASPQLDARSTLPLMGDNQNWPQTQKCPWRQDHPKLRSTGGEKNILSGQKL